MHLHICRNGMWKTQKTVRIVNLSGRRELKDLLAEILLKCKEPSHPLCSAQEDRNLQLYEFAENLCGIEAHTAGRVKTLPYKIKV